MDKTNFGRRCSPRVYREVTAGGGLVTDNEGRSLMIMRNGMWDLPKGHQEAGEDIRQCAEREVMEETGLDLLDVGDLLCVTDHTYRRDGEWFLKHTWWFDMKYSGKGATTPQTEEGITEAVWVEPADIAVHLQHTYPSIIEVFRKKAEKFSER